MTVYEWKSNENRWFRGIPKWEYPKMVGLFHMENPNLKWMMNSRSLRVRPWLRKHPRIPNANHGAGIFTYIYHHLPKKWPKCRKIFNTWSIWDIYIYTICIYIHEFVISATKVDLQWGIRLAIYFMVIRHLIRTGRVHIDLASTLGLSDGAKIDNRYHK